MKIRQVIYDSLFIIIIEISFLFVYLKGPIPFYWGFPFAGPIIHYFYTYISQFTIVLILPRLPQLIFGITDLKISMFLGLSLIWVPSIFLSIWLTRVFLSEMHFKRYIYLSYLPILFIIFNPHTLYELFSFDATHMFAAMSQVFFMYASILSGIIFYYYGRWKFLIIALISILLVNYQTFPLSYFIIFVLFLIFSPIQTPRLSHLLRSTYLICLAAFIAFIDLFAVLSVAPGSPFPYSNLNIPSFFNIIDPNFRVILIANAIHKNLLSVITFQNFANGPFSPGFMPNEMYTSILLIIGLMTFIPFFILFRWKRRLLLPLYLSFISFEVLDVFGNPWISLVWPQHISIFYVISLLFNNDTVFYYPLKILASLLFLFSSISIAKLLNGFFKPKLKLYRDNEMRSGGTTPRRRIGLPEVVKVTTLAAVVLLMISPATTYAIYSTPDNQGHNTMEVFYAYFDGVKDPSIYFWTSSNNIVMEKIIDSSTLYGYVDNPEIAPEQSYPMSLALSMYGQVEPSLQSEFINYIMNTFNYNYIVTDSSSLAHLLSNSSFFSLSLRYDWLYIFKISKEEYDSRDVLLTSSATQLISFVNFYRTFPQWIYSPYLLNLSSMDGIFKSDTVYSPSYVTPYSYFIHVNDLSVIIPARYTDNTYYSDKWEMGYFVTVAQATWSQNIRLLNNYQYQNDINENYGVIYTEDRGASLHMIYDAPEGNYFAIARLLLSNAGGSLNISINGMQHNITTTSSNASYFEYAPLGNVSSNGRIQVTVTNVAGFNSVNAILLVPEQTFSEYIQRFEQYSALSAPLSSLPPSPLAKYPISIVSNVSDPQLIYEQEINVSSRETNLINGNWTNIAFEYPDGSIIPAWIQYYSTNLKYAIIWLRMYGEMNRTIYLLVYNSTTNLMSQTGFLGEAPDLSPIYGEYFNAPAVFGSGNAWDWRSSLEGWFYTNSSATYVDNGIHVYNGTSGGIYLRRDVTAGSAFSVYGWTENSTVIQINGYSNENNTGVATYGWVGGQGFYDLQEYPFFTYNVSVPEERYLNYTFTDELLYNNTSESFINGTAYHYPPDPYPTIYNVSYIFLRESVNDPQYYEYAFLRTLPLGDLMPLATVYWGK